jgi:membrane protease YdiL (CAAX protease family)
VLFAALREHGVVFSGAVTSVAFGLWHIAPTLNVVRINRPNASRIEMAHAVALAIAATTGAGVVFIWLRAVTEGLAAPFALHSTVNSLGAVVAVAANRRRASTSGA